MREAFAFITQLIGQILLQGKELYVLKRRTCLTTTVSLIPIQPTPGQIFTRDLGESIANLYMATPPTSCMAMRQPEADPSPDEIASALAALEEHETTTPPVRHIRTLARAGITPSINVGTMSILGWSITEGSPRHGAMRSDDHVSFWETRFTSRESCPDCDSHERTYTYSSHHHIAGHLIEKCDYCEHTFKSEGWG